MEESGIDAVSLEYCAHPPREGNLVRPLIDSLHTYQQILHVIEKECRQSVWIVISFINADHFTFPNGESFWEFLSRVCQQVKDVRLLCWRNPDFFNNNQLMGYQKEIDQLKEHCPTIKVKWDDSGADVAHCHHEKSWLIDAGLPSCVAFVGGITLSGHGSTSQKHDEIPWHTNHDIFAEIRGPATTDVHHHFVQRWNYAHYHPSSKFQPHWPPEAAPLPYPAFTESNTTTDIRPEKNKPGSAVVQVQRTIRANYINDQSPILNQFKRQDNSPVLDMRNGEESIFQQYRQAIQSAKELIYIENQHLCDEEILRLLIEALKRKVYVICVVPTGARGIYFLMHYARGRAKRWNVHGLTTAPRYSDVFLKYLPQLDEYPNFLLTGLANVRNEKINFIYVHSKLMIVDDLFFTLGSANIVDISFVKDHSELNVAVWDGNTARQLRYDLFQEHLGMDVSTMTVEGAFTVFQEVARKNRAILDSGTSTGFQGHAFQTGAGSYGSVESYIPFTDRLMLYGSNIGITIHQSSRLEKALSFLVFLYGVMRFVRFVETFWTGQ